MLAGVALAVLSAISYNVGFVVEKLAVGHMPEIDARHSVHMVRTLVSSPLWLAGFACLLGGFGLQVLALSRVSIAVVQPILASGIVLLVLVSRVALKERLGRAEWAGVWVVLGALALVGLSADKVSDAAGTQGTLGAVLAWVVPTAFAAAAAFWAASRVGRATAALFRLAAGLLYGAASLATKAASTVIQTHGLLPAVPRVLASPDPYLFVVLSGLGLLVFQTGLQRCQVSILVPVSNVISSGYLVGVGLVVFGEHMPAEPWRFALRLVAFAGIVVGMALLARGQGLTMAYGAGPDEVVDAALAGELS